jgi:hypothetical protein
MSKRNAQTHRKQRTRKTARRKAVARRADSAGKGRKAARGARTARPTRKAARPARRSAAANSRGGARAKPAALERERRRLREEEMVPTPPSTLDFDRKGTAAASGRASLKQYRRAHTESGPDLTAGDIDADWGEAYADGDEAPGGDNPTPDQDVVEEIGRALGVEYDDAEELKGSDKITERDKHRWEYDPASAEDYRDRNKKQ